MAHMLLQRMEEEGGAILCHVGEGPGGKVEISHLGSIEGVEGEVAFPGIGVIDPEGGITQGRVEGTQNTTDTHPLKTDGVGTQNGGSSSKHQGRGRLCHLHERV